MRERENIFDIRLILSNCSFLLFLGELKDWFGDFEVFDVKIEILEFFNSFKRMNIVFLSIVVMRGLLKVIFLRFKFVIFFVVFSLYFVVVMVNFRVDYESI